MKLNLVEGHVYCHGRIKAKWFPSYSFLFIKNTTLRPINAERQLITEKIKQTCINEIGVAKFVHQKSI